MSDATSWRDGRSEKSSLIKQIHRAVYDLNIKERDKVRLVDRVGEAEFRMVEGANPRIQLESLLAHFAVIGEEII